MIMCKVSRGVQSIMSKTMQKTWTLQLAGLIGVVLLLSFTIPRYAQMLPERIAQQALQQLHAQGMAWAAVQAEDRNLTVSGSAASPAQQQQAVQALQSLWYVRSVKNAITPRLVTPYTLFLQWDGKALSVDGYVSSEEAKTALTQQLDTAFGHNIGKNAVQVGAGAPEHWETFAAALVSAIKPLESASIRMIDQAVSIDGKAKTSQQVKAIQQTLEPFSQQGYTLSFNLVALDNAAVVCQREFNRLLAQDKILFSSGGSSIDSRSNPLLQELADAAVFCADSTILISGHTDNVGSEEDNLKLSEQRAKAVKGWLFNEGGVPLERMKTAGKGSSEPVASNDAEEGRAKNRRIEFTVEGI